MTNEDTKAARIVRIIGERNMLKGTFIKFSLIGGTPDRYGFENISQNMTKPEEVKLIWTVINPACRNSLGYVTVEEALGKEATLRDGVVSVYCGYGRCIVGELEGGKDAKAAVVEITEVPRPKVRNHVELRWHHDGYRGFWQKYLKSTGKGWVRA
jgi:hypothetical protein